MIVGMDFGTTNSGMAVYDGRSVTVLPLDPANRNPRVLRTALYITNDQAVHIGRAAVDTYFEQNIGRAVKMQKVWIGELEVYGADMYYVTDAYAWVDVFSPGRLLLSVKTSLRDRNYPGTIVGQFYYSLENIIALYMSVIRTRAQQVLGQAPRQVVLGRPVRFSTDPQHDRLAEARLLQAAFRAGYEKVYLQYEPIAAAFNYETTVNKEQNVLIFDFGGGTLDITVMRLGNPKRRRVLATGGIPIAGDVFDKMLVQAKLTRHFGAGSLYGDRRKSLTVPQWIYDSFSDWQTILELQSADNKRILQEIAQTARRRFQIEALINLVSSNYGLKMFDIVERAKRTLSEKRGAEILLEGPGFKVREFVTRTEFETIIRAEIRAIEDHLQETVQASGLAPDQIDAVIRTGGSSQIPVFYEILCRQFGRDKVHSIDVFSSVTAGLGVIAHGIEKGEIELPAHTPDEATPPPEATHSRPNVSPANLELLQRRIAVDEGTSQKDGADPATSEALVFLDAEGRVTAVPYPATRWQQEDSIPLADLGIEGHIVRVIKAPSEKRLLLITSKYRFLLITPRRLMEMQGANLAITDLHRFEKYEQITAVCHWAAYKQYDKLLLATSLGLARPYPMEVLQTNIEGPVPLRFDRPLLGVPLAALGSNNGEALVMVTASGRGARWAVKALSISGTQVTNCGRDDRVTGARLVAENEEVVLVTADGYARRLAAASIPVPPKTNAKGKSLVARRSEIVDLVPLHPSPPFWLVTSTQMVKCLPGDIGDRLPREASTKTYRLLRLPPQESITAIFNP